jgi:hypothetical protein
MRDICLVYFFLETKRPLCLSKGAKPIARQIRNNQWASSFQPKVIGHLTKGKIDQ